MKQYLAVMDPDGEFSATGETPDKAVQNLDCVCSSTDADEVVVYEVTSQLIRKSHWIPKSP